MVLDGGRMARESPIARMVESFYRPRPQKVGIMAEPWYGDGLRFRCTRCGNCCTGAPGYVWVNATEIEALARFRGETAEEVSALYTRAVDDRRSLREKANGDCVFFDRREGCTVYPQRPRQCRTWPFWESNVATPGAWKRTCEVCPGSGQGELISAEEITRRLKVIRL
jgi:Fe-S-cluster containining protein